MLTIRSSDEGWLSAIHAAIAKDGVADYGRSGIGLAIRES